MDCEGVVDIHGLRRERRHMRQLERERCVCHLKVTQTLLISAENHAYHALITSFNIVAHRLISTLHCQASDLKVSISHNGQCWSVHRSVEHLRQTTFDILMFSHAKGTLRSGGHRLLRKVRVGTQKFDIPRCGHPQMCHQTLTFIHEKASRKLPGIGKQTPLSKFPLTRHVFYDSQAHPAYVSFQGLFHKHTRLSKDFVT